MTKMARSLNDLSESAQQSARSLSNLSMNAKFFHPEGEMAERSTGAQGSHTETAFRLLLRDRAYF